MQFESELRFAREAGRKAGELALRHWRTGLEMEDKTDASPVTAADRASEQLLADLIAGAFPHDGLLGEEGAARESASGRQWIVDPIDGTRDFVRGNRLWCNLIGLVLDGEPVVGVATFPALEEQYYAVRGGGAWRDGERLAVSRISEASRAVVCASQLTRFERPPGAETVMEFLGRFWASRSMGGAWDAMFVCCGQAELWLEPSAKPWDLAALAVIAEEAGCRFFDFSGQRTIFGGSAVICAPGLEPLARGFLGLPAPVRA
jgi:histidinol phosphatase-like enzyme (inositol monophosphatase family)